MTELAQFLRDRYAERRAIAEAAAHGSAGCWTQTDPERKHGWIEDEAGDTVVFDEGSPSGEQARHIAANDPAVVLADLDAKLALINDLLAWPHYAWDGREEYACPKFMDAERWEALYSDIGERTCCCGRDEHIDRALRLLALPHADHADYQESRRP